VVGTPVTTTAPYTGRESHASNRGTLIQFRRVLTQVPVAVLYCAIFRVPEYSELLVTINQSLRIIEENSEY
jgi:hypothetical protein